MSIETTIPFVVYCDLYTEMRNNLFLAINPLLEANGLSLSNDNLLVKFLLYCDEIFSEDNRHSPFFKKVILNIPDRGPYHFLC